MSELKSKSLSKYKYTKGIHRSNLENQMPTKQLQQSLLIIAFSLLATAILVAYSNPATSYELSIYERTPLFVWVAVCFSLLIAVVVAFNGQNSIKKIALFLAGNSLLVVVILPLIRGYYHLGGGDPMSHLGWAKDLSAGVVNPTDIGYPAVHSIAVFVSKILDVPLTQSFYYVSISFVILFLIFVPVVVRLLTNTQLTVFISVFSAILLLPINLISVHMTVHPTSQAILFSPIIFYNFVAYHRSGDHRYASIFPVGAFALLMIHPQQAANFLLVLGAIVAIQAMFFILNLTNRSETKTIYVQTGILAIMFWVWFKGSAFVGPFTKFITDLFTGDQPTAEEVSQRGTSLTELGTGPEELFIKLFLISLLMCSVAGFYILVILTDTFLRDKESHRQEIIYLIFAFIPISILFLLYVIANITTQYFRHLGFIMVMVSIVGSLGLGHFIERFRLSDKQSRTILTGLFIILLSFSLMIVYPSPYIYQDSGHVSKGQISGYETSFDHRSEGTEFLYLRSSTDRYADFHRTTPRPDAMTAPDHFANQDLANHYQESKYLVITSKDRELDLGLYNGLRYSSDDFQYLESDSTISRVQSNGDFELYLITGNNINNNTQEIDEENDRR